MKDHILNLIKEKENIYRGSYSEMIGDYNRELETIKGYNGRQLLELVQNCDDQGASEILIELNRESNSISISNVGEAFSENGYRSLFIANLSSKTDVKKYIGNKGLGFRSIINWSEEIEIQSNQVSLKYSKTNQSKNFQRLFTEDKRQEIYKKEGLNSEIIPIPFLVLPEVYEIPVSKYATRIIIKYKEEFLEDILTQINDIQQETILFLKSIKRIKFRGVNGKQNVLCDRISNSKLSNELLSPQKTIIFQNKKKWNIYEFESELPEEFLDKNKKQSDFYQIKIALEKGVKNTYEYLYSFFPTRIQLKQPYILHATFDLDSTRNQLNNSEKNKFILEQIISFLIKVAVSLTKGNPTYDAYNILNYNHKADTLNVLGYYDLLDKALMKEKIYPCVDGEYRSFNEVEFLSNEYAKVLWGSEGREVFKNHLIANNNLEFLPNDIACVSKSESFIDKVSKFGRKELTITQRAIAIYELLNVNDTTKNSYFSFLINDKEELIDASEYIYTPITKDKELVTPEFTSIQFVNNHLYNHLVNLLGFNTNEHKNKSRFVYDKLKNCFNIHSYEPATLAQKIISQTYEELQKQNSDKVAVIQEMHQCLYANFLKMDEETKIPENVSVPLLNKNKEIKPAGDLLFGKPYSTGSNTELIFEGIYNENNYVIPSSGLGFLDENIELYLSWLGVSNYAIYENGSHHFRIEDYKQSIKKTQPQDIRAIDINTISIINSTSVFEQIEFEKLLLWIFLDSTLMSQINDLQHQDKIFITAKHKKSKTQLTGINSFLKFLINDFFDIEDFYLNNRYNWVNDQIVDYQSDIFIQNNISKNQIDNILILLGAKDDFTQLSIDKVAQILINFPKQYPNGNNSQSIYKMALKHYGVHKTPLNYDVKLFTNTGDDKRLVLKENDQVYFSDKIKLPKKLWKDFPVFNFPARSGGKEAISFFNIKDLSKVEVEIGEFTELEVLTHRFNKNLEQLKPLILAYRVFIIEDEKAKKDQASRVNQLEIILCSDIEYSIENKTYQVDLYEYVHKEKQTYYVKINKDVDFSKNLNFINTCIDILALAFDVSIDKSVFRNIFYHSPRENELFIREDLGVDTLKEARDLLGLTDYKVAFWNAIFKCKGIKTPLSFENNVLRAYLQTQLKFELIYEIDYESVHIDSELDKVLYVLEALQIEITVFNIHYAPYQLSLSVKHQNNLEVFFEQQKPYVQTHIWELSKTDKQLKIEFIQNLHEVDLLKNKFKEIANNEKENRNFDYEQKIKEIVRDLGYKKYKTDSVLDLDNIWDQNFTHFEEKDREFVKASIELDSLMYFENEIATIKQRLDQYDESRVEEVSRPGVILKIDSSNYSMIDSKKLKFKQKRKTNTQKGVYKVAVGSNHLKQIGDDAEKIVVDVLKANDNYTSVDWISRRNEGASYDISYVKDGKTKYVEVKSFDHGRFIMSKSEFDYGLKHKENYEVFLVNKHDKIITVIDDFFDNQEKYKPIIREYEVNLS